MDLEKLKKLIEKVGNQVKERYNVEKVVVSHLEKAGGKDHYFVNFHYHMKDGFQPLNRFGRQNITGDIVTYFKEITDITLTTMSTSSFSKEGGKNIDMSESKSGVKYIVTEEQYRKYSKSTEILRDLVTKYLNKYITSGKRKIIPKSRNYGNLREDWCVNGKEIISAIYGYDNEKFVRGYIFITLNLVRELQDMFNIRESFAVHLIEEWYEDIMVPKFEQIIGETGLYIDNITIKTKSYDCIPESTIPEGITDEEMIDFIVNNTLYRKQDVISKIESGDRNLEDFYLDIVDTIKRKQQLGL
jgi:hypothetical protein